MTVKETTELLAMCRAHAKTGRIDVSPGYSVSVYRNLANLHISFSTGSDPSNKAVTRRARRHATNIGLQVVSCAGDMHVQIHSCKDFHRVDDLMIFICGKSMQKTARNNAPLL